MFLYCPIAHESLYTVFNASRDGWYLLYGEVQVEGETQSITEDRSAWFFSKKCEDCGYDFEIDKVILNNLVIFFIDHIKLYNGSSVYLQFNTHELIKTSSFTVYEIC